MRTAWILACTTILSPLVFHTLVAASTFDPLPELPIRPRRAIADASPRVLPPPRERVELARRTIGVDGLYQAPTSRGRTLALTLDPALQADAERLLGDTDPALGAVVIMATDGRLLALAGRSAQGGDRPDLAVDPWAPSASVFKIVTAAALVDAGARPDKPVCVHGGAAGLLPENLVDDRRKDDVCASLAYGVAKSNNAILGKLAVKMLRSDVLARYAAAFGYGRPWAYGRPSTAEIPAEPLELARAAAGFWHTELSPLGGAVLAATIASGGLAVTPYLTEDDRADATRVLGAETARTVAAMLAGTTEMGTARTAFHDAVGRAYLRVRVAGKTGTLSRRPVAGLAPLDFSWFVGFAPADHPTVVVSVLLGTTPRHHTRAATLARQILEAKFGR